MKKAHKGSIELHHGGSLRIIKVSSIGKMSDFYGRTNVIIDGKAEVFDEKIEEITEKIKKDNEREH